MATGFDVDAAISREKTRQKKLLTKINGCIESYQIYDTAGNAFFDLRDCSLVIGHQDVKVLQSTFYNIEWYFKQLKIPSSTGHRRVARITAKLLELGLSPQQYIEQKQSDVETGCERLKTDKQMMVNRLKLMNQGAMKDAILSEIESYNTEQLNKKTIKKTAKQRAEAELNESVDKLAESIGVVKKAIKLYIEIKNENLLKAALHVASEQEKILLRLVEKVATGRALNLETPTNQDFKCMFLFLILLFYFLILLFCVFVRSCTFIWCSL